MYARVSSQQQADAHTIASQVATLKERIRGDGFRLDEELCFVDEGYSGSTLFRPALERLRDQAAACSFDRLYVHSPDRLARSYAYQVLLVDELQRHGIAIVFFNRDIGQSPEDNLLLQMQGMMAEYERAKIMERSRRGKRHAAQVGLLSVLSAAPYGYRYLGKYEGGGQARYEIDEAQADIVRLIFAWVGLERCSIGEVCRRLQQRGIASPRGKSYWDRTTVWALLKNPAYIGKAQFGKTRVGPMRPRLRAQRGRSLQSRRAHSTYDTPAEERVAIAVPAIVDEALFDAVREQLAENRRRQRQQQRGAKYLLQGLLVCGQCGYAYYGKPLSRSARKGRPRDYAYYRCVGTDAYRFGGKAVCGNKQCRTDLLDRAVWEDVCALLAQPQRVHAEYERRLRGQHKKSGRPTEQLAKMIGKVRSGLARLIDAYQEGHLDKADFESRIAALKERLQKLQAEDEASSKTEWERANLQVMIEHVEMFAERVKAGLEDADWQARREIMRALIKQVEVGEDGIRVVYKVQPCPFESGPERGRSQHCWRGNLSGVGEPDPGRPGSRAQGAFCRHARPQAKEQGPSGPLCG
jgi:site-specific DNA recombinase